MSMIYCATHDVTFDNDHHDTEHSFCRGTDGLRLFPPEATNFYLKLKLNYVDPDVDQSEGLRATFLILKEDGTWYEDDSVIYDLGCGYVWHDEFDVEKSEIPDLLTEIETEDEGWYDKTWYSYAQRNSPVRFMRKDTIRFSEYLRGVLARSDV